MSFTKSLLKVLLPTIVLAGGVIIAAWAFRVPIVQSFAETSLHSRGFADAKLNISLISLTEVIIDDLSLADAVKAKQVLVRFSAQGLLNGIIEEVRVQEAYVDASDPDADVFDAARNLLEGDGSNTSAPLKILKISFSDGVLTKANKDQSLEVILNGEMDEDLQAKGSAFVKGQINTPSGVIHLGRTELTIVADVKAETVSVAVTEARLSQEGEKTAFTPMIISMNAHLINGVLDFKVNVKGDNGIALTDIDGQYETSTKMGLATVKINDLEFRRDALQPDHLIPLIGDLPLMDVLLSGDADIRWNTEAVSAVGNFGLNGLNVQIDAVEVKSQAMDISFNASLDANGNLLTHDSRISAAEMNISSAGNNYTAESLEILGSGQGDTPQSVTVSGNVGKSELFPAIKLQSQIEISPDELKFKVQIDGAKIPLKVEGHGSHSLVGNGGTARVVLSPVHFQSKKTQPKHYSALMPDLGGEVTGEFSGVADLNWSGDLIPTASIEVRMQDAGFISPDISVSGLNLSAKTTKISQATAFSALVTQLDGAARVGDRNFSLKKGTIKVEIEKDWKNATFSYEDLTIRPSAGMQFKPDVAVTGTGTLKEGQVQTIGILKTDLLGKFAEFMGRYQSKENSGSATFDLLDIPFEEDGVTPTDLIRNFPEDIILNGEIGANVTVTFAKGQTQSSGSVRLNDISMTQDGMKVSGLNGAIEFDNLDPITIQKPQELNASEIFTGISIKQPKIKFRLNMTNGNPIFYIDDLRFGAFGGAALVSNAILDTGAPSNTIELQLSSLALNELLALSELEGISATGQVRGKIPLTFDGDKLTVKLGRLENVGPGSLKVKSEEARQALAAGGGQTKLLFDVLENFNYSKLSLKIDKPASGEDLVTLHTEGANPDVENNRTVILNVNLSTNLDRIFNALLEGYRLSEKALRATVRSRKK
ncbi:MAG: YdbH domain-containing protein [Pseudomonas marincola]